MKKLPLIFVLGLSTLLATQASAGDRWGVGFNQSSVVISVGNNHHKNSYKYRKKVKHYHGNKRYKSCQQQGYYKGRYAKSRCHYNKGYHDGYRDGYQDGHYDQYHNEYHSGGGYYESEYGRDHDKGRIVVNLPNVTVFSSGPRDFVGQCWSVQKDGYWRGKPALIGGKMCRDRGGNEYVVPSSRYLIHYRRY